MADEIDDRTRRALTECISVVPMGGDIYRVVGENGNGEYRVDARTGSCTCPDAKHNLAPGERCKHARRVAFATGDEAIPPAMDREDIDDLLGVHVSGSPAMAATDGGDASAGGVQGKPVDPHDGEPRPFFSDDQYDDNFRPGGRYHTR